MPPKSAIEIPSLLTGDQRERMQTELIANMLANIGQEEVRLDTLALVNGNEEDDLVPGESVTYRAARKNLAENKEKILKAVGEERFEKAIEQLKQR